MYVPNTLWTWAFMGTACVQAAIVLSLESYIFAKFQESLVPGRAVEQRPQAKATPTYLTLFIFGFLYQLILVYDSLRLKNTIQVIGLCVYNIGMLIYAAIQYDQVKNAINSLITFNYINQAGDGGSGVWILVRPYLIAVPCVISLFTVVLSVITWKLYDEFAWTIYKHISADLRMRRRFLTFQIYIALLKFDFFFFLGFTVQFLVVVTQIRDAEKWVTVAAIPITILILFMAAFWARRENAVGMITTIVCYVGGLAYFIFKLARMYQPSHEDNYKPVRKTLTSFTVITILLIIGTIVNASVCMANFNKGLKQHVLKHRIGDEEEKVVRMNDLPDPKSGLAQTNRMEID